MKLLFVFNADKNPVATVKDTVWKVVAPDSYPCNLCKITYGVFTEDPEWREFVDGLPVETEFLHRDEFWEQYPKLQEEPLPAVFALSDEGVAVWLSAEQVNAQKTLDGLKRLVSEHLDVV